MKLFYQYLLSTDRRREFRAICNLPRPLKDTAPAVSLQEQTSPIRRAAPSFFFFFVMLKLGAGLGVFLWPLPSSPPPPPPPVPPSPAPAPWPLFPFGPAALCFVVQAGEAWGKGEFEFECGPHMTTIPHGGPLEVWRGVYLSLLVLRFVFCS